MTDKAVPPAEIKPTEIERFTLTMKLDATVTLTNAVGESQDWVKPGVTASIGWRGVPTEAELTTASTFLQENVLNPTLNDVLSAVSQQVQANRQQHR